MHEAYTALSNRFSICCLKIIFLWIVIHISKTSSLASTLIEFSFNMCLWWDLPPRVMNWNFRSLAFNEFNLNQFKILSISKTRFSLIYVNLSSDEYKVLSSAKLQISDCSIIMNISLINILKKIEPNIDPLGIPRVIFDHLL